MDYIQRNPGGTPFWYGGRSFTEAEIETIRRITDDPWCTTQSAIARAVCTALNWTMANGQPKLATCRKALQQMEEHGVIWLPLPTQESRGTPLRRRGPPLRIRKCCCLAIVSRN